jgi:hypothetical protein
LKDGLPAVAPVTSLDKNTLNNAHAPVYVIEPKSYSPYSDQWSIFVEHRLTRGFAVETALLSSMGIHLLEQYDTNQLTLTPFCGCFRHAFDPYTTRVEYLNFAGGSTYYGGQLKLTGRLLPGLQLQTVYRFAKAIDDATQPFTDQQSRPADPQLIYALRQVRSPSPFDIAHRLVLMASYDTPWKRKALAHWRFFTLITAQTGLPFTPQLAINGLNNGGVQLPNRVGDGSLLAAQRSAQHWFNTSLNPADPHHAFEIPGINQYGTSGYDIVRGPGLVNVDASVARTFALGDRWHLETRVEAFNLMNRTNLGLPQRILGVPSSGAINHTSTPSRQLQIVARVEW